MTHHLIILLLGAAPATPLGPTPDMAGWSAVNEAKTWLNA
jgi:hypothetical protein